MRSRSGKACEEACVGWVILGWSSSALIGCGIRERVGESDQAATMDQAVARGSNDRVTTTCVRAC